MRFGEAVRTCLRKSFSFSGRASRSEFWWFILFVGVVQTGLQFVDDVISGGERQLLATLFALAMVSPQLAAAWRRMHDTGRSGLYVLYPLIVVVGIGLFANVAGAATTQGVLLFEGIVGVVLLAALFVLLISPLLVLWWLTRPSEPGANDYGPLPRR